MELSIVVPVYNELDELKSCLDSVASMEKGGDRVEVVVVDDGSRVNIKSVFLECSKRNPGLKWTFRQLPRNTGRFIARMEGVKRSSYDTVMLLDVRCRPSPDFLKVLRSYKYRPIIPSVRAEYGEGWVGRVMYLLRRRLYSRTYRELADSGEVNLTQDNYESHAKGTVLLVDKEMFLDACKRVRARDKYSNDESWLLKEIISEKPIRIVNSLVISYEERSGIWDECIHFFLRGPRFVQNYINPGTRFFLHLIILLAFAVACIAILVTSPVLIIYPIGLFVLSIIALSVIIAEKPSDILKSILVLPFLVTSYTLGIYWGLVVGIMQGNLSKHNANKF